jgi:hypothetical protein
MAHAAPPPPSGADDFLLHWLLEDVTWSPAAMVRRAERRRGARESRRRDSARALFHPPADS